MPIRDSRHAVVPRSTSPKAAQVATNSSRTVCRATSTTTTRRSSTTRHRTRATRLPAPTTATESAWTWASQWMAEAWHQSTQQPVSFNRSSSSSRWSTTQSLLEMNGNKKNLINQKTAFLLLKHEWILWWRKISSYPCLSDNSADKQFLVSEHI